MTIPEIIAAFEGLRERHHVSPDCWYTCPAQNREHNAKIDALIDRLRESRGTFEVITPEGLDSALKVIRQILEPLVAEGRPMSIRATREAIPLPLAPGDRIQRHRKGGHLITIEVEDPKK